MPISLSICESTDPDFTPASLEGMLSFTDASTFTGGIIFTPYLLDLKPLQNIQSRLLKKSYAANLFSKVVSYAKDVEEGNTLITQVAYVKLTNSVIKSLHNSIRLSTSRSIDIAYDGFLKTLLYAIKSSQDSDAIIISVTELNILFNDNLRDDVYLVCQVS